jgi:intracellular sulfur oxidation DsrE/DsrF family protein
MFRHFILLLALLLPFVPAQAQEETAAAPYQAVLHLTSANPRTWNAMLGNLEHLLQDPGDDAQLEVVAHGPGLGLLQKGGHQDLPRMQALAGQGVRFLACENTMRKKNVSKEDLLNLAGTVPSGMGWLVKRQHEGWAYLRITD